jgi:hypothetical protein
MPHATGDDTSSSTEHPTEQKVNQTIPTLRDSSANCSKFPTNLSKILKLEQIVESKWKECEKVKTTKKYDKIAVDVNDNFKGSDMVGRVLLDMEQEHGRELCSNQLKIISVRWNLYVMLKILIYISCLTFSFWTIFILPCFHTFNDYYLPVCGSEEIYIGFNCDNCKTV